MSRTFLIGILRSIRLNLSRFIAIISITALGAIVLSGLLHASVNITKNIEMYYDKEPIEDIRMLSSTGFAQEDMNQIQAIEDVELVTPIYTLDAISISNGEEQTARLNNLPADSKKQELNQVKLVEGEYPKKEDEVLLLKSRPLNENYQIGDQVTFSNDKNTKFDQSLNQTTYTIVGFGEAPHYLSYRQGSSPIGSGTLEQIFYLPQANFLSPIYSELYVQVKNTISLNSFGETYLKTIDTVMKEVEAIQKPEWKILNREANAGYKSLKTNAESISNLSSLFPIIFFLVVALVTLASMTRMLDEDRQLIGTFKAIGYKNKHIAFKYLGYVLSATLIGSIIGVIVGTQLIPSVIWDSYGQFYRFHPFDNYIHLDIALLTIVVSSVCTAISIAFVLRRTLKETPASMMLPKASKDGKRVWLEYIKPIWKRFSFSNKVTTRNIFLRKSRMFMTMVGVGGCCALLITGFGLRDTMSTILPMQYESVIHYDAFIPFDESTPEAELASLTSNEANFQNSLMIEKQMVEAEDVENIELISPKDANGLKQMVTLEDATTGKVISFNQDSVIISEKLASLLNVKAGDSTVISVPGTDETYTLKIQTISKNYVFHYIYIGEAAYQKTFDKEPRGNSYLVQMNQEVSESEINEQLSLISGVRALQSVDTISATMTESMNGINGIVFVIVGLSGLLALVVLYNLSSINIGERQREIATLKVLGFYEKETFSYIFRETFILSILGCFVGVFMGGIIFANVIQTVEMPFARFARETVFSSYLYSIVLTLLFTTVVSFIMTKKIRKIDMLESLKSMD